MKLFFLYLAAVVSVAFIASASSAHQSHDHNGAAQEQCLQFKEGSVHMHVSFVNPPVVGRESFIQLQARNPQTHESFDLNDDVQVVLWMPSMGHGSAHTKVEPAFDVNGQRIQGAYNVRNVYFVMGGDWEIQVHLTDKNGHQEMQSFMIQLEGGGHHGH